jgi:hypothetical protein
MSDAAHPLGLQAEQHTNRRKLLKLGLAASLLLGAAGAGVALLQPGLQGRQLSPSARQLMRAVALAVMDGLWPEDSATREAALHTHLSQLDATIANLPAATRAELSQLLALLCSSAGRLALTGLGSDWQKASTAELQQALNAMRVSQLDLRQQIYRALRELNCGVFFCDPANGALVGYPGPRVIA